MSEFNRCKVCGSKNETATPHAIGWEITLNGEIVAQFIRWEYFIKLKP